MSRFPAPKPSISTARGDGFFKDKKKKPGQGLPSLEAALTKGTVEDRLLRRVKARATLTVNPELGAPVLRVAVAMKPSEPDEEKRNYQPITMEDLKALSSKISLNDEEEPVPDETKALTESFLAAYAEDQGIEPTSLRVDSKSLAASQASRRAMNLVNKIPLLVKTWESQPFSDPEKELVDFALAQTKLYALLREKELKVACDKTCRDRKAEAEPGLTQWFANRVKKMEDWPQDSSLQEFFFPKKNSKSHLCLTVGETSAGAGFSWTNRQTKIIKSDFWISQARKEAVSTDVGTTLPTPDQKHLASVLSTRYTVAPPHDYNVKWSFPAPFEKTGPTALLQNMSLVQCNLVSGKGCKVWGKPDRMLWLTPVTRDDIHFVAFDEGAAIEAMQAEAARYLSDYKNRDKMMATLVDTNQRFFLTRNTLTETAGGQTVSSKFVELTDFDVGRIDFSDQVKDGEDTSPDVEDPVKQDPKEEAGKAASKGKGLIKARSMTVVSVPKNVDYRTPNPERDKRYFPKTKQTPEEESDLLLETITGRFKKCRPFVQEWLRSHDYLNRPPRKVAKLLKRLTDKRFQDDYFKVIILRICDADTFAFGKDVRADDDDPGFEV